MTEHVSDIKPVLTLAFADAPCRCVRNHNPNALTTEQHHIFPQADQIRIWGRVRDARLEPMCPTSHRAVHLYIDYLLGRRNVRPRVNAYVRGVAETGVERIRAAERGE